MGSRDLQSLPQLQNFSSLLRLDLGTFKSKVNVSMLDLKVLNVIFMFIAKIYRA